MFQYDPFYYFIQFIAFLLLLNSCLYTFGLPHATRKFDEGFKALVMMGSSLTFIVVIEWLRNV